MNNLDKYRWYLSGPFQDDYLAAPNETSKVKETFTREKEERAGYKRNLVGKLVFTGADFDWLYEAESSTFRCETISLAIHKKCSGTWSLWFTGTLFLNKGNWDLDQCKVELEFEAQDSYACIDQNGDTELNMFELIALRKTVSLAQGTVETTTCDIETTCPIEGDGWTFYRREYIYDMGVTLTGTDYYARYNLGGGVYKPAIIYDYYSYNYSNVAGEYGYKVIGIDLEEIDNGVQFNDLLVELVAQACPSLTIKSDFFQINPQNVSTTNYVTGLTSQVLNLVLFQKSDVKRPGAAENATIGKLTLNKILAMLYNVFQVKYRVEGTVLEIEHVSFFDEGNNLDFTTGKFSKYIFHKNKYSYDTSKLPKFEKFRWMEAKYPDFVGTPIEYTGNCVVSSGAGSEKLYDVTDFSTDLLHVLDNPASDSNLVSDDGFVLVACSDTYTVLTETGILDTEERLNNTLAWAQLHDKYWRHKRVLKVGLLNGIEETFASSIRSRKQVRISVPICCEDIFSPEALYKTELGWGEVDRCEFNLMTEMMDIDLLHDILTEYRLACPVLGITPGVDLLDFEFTPDEHATAYIVKLYSASNVFLAQESFSAPWSGNISGQFADLGVDTSYYLEATVFNSTEAYSRTCEKRLTRTTILACPTLTLDPRGLALYFEIAGITSQADSVTLQILDGTTLVDSFTATAPFTNPEVDFIFDLLEDYEYNYKLLLTKGAYEKECQVGTFRTSVVYEYALKLSEGPSADCGAAVVTYYSDSPTFTVGMTLYTDNALFMPAYGFDWAIQDGGNAIWPMDRDNGTISNWATTTC